MSSIKVSILITTYNHEKYIEQSIESALSQCVDFKYEIVIYDDCSSDKTVEIIRSRYIEKVILHERKTNVGLCANFYDALSSAKGDYVFDLAGDDYLYNDGVLQACVSFLEKHSEYGSVSGGTQICDKYNKVVGKIQNSKFKIKILSSKIFFGRGTILWARTNKKFMER